MSGGDACAALASMKTKAELNPAIATAIRITKRPRALRKPLRRSKLLVNHGATDRNHGYAAARGPQAPGGRSGSLRSRPWRVISCE